MFLSIILQFILEAFISFFTISLTWAVAEEREEGLDPVFPTEARTFDTFAFNLMIKILKPEIDIFMGILFMSIS